MRHLGDSFGESSIADFDADAFTPANLSLTVWAKNGLRDVLTRDFEFYPPGVAAVGARGEHTVESYSSIDFLLDNHYELKSTMPQEAEIGVSSQVLEKNASGAKPVIEWDIAGSQTSSIHFDPRSDRLLPGEYALHLQGETTQQIGGKPDVCPIMADFKNRGRSSRARRHEEGRESLS